jgi:hypothetical protein
MREKKLAREQWDFYWTIQQMERLDMVNHPPDEQKDIRMIPKLYVYPWYIDHVHLCSVWRRPAQGRGECQAVG